MLGTREEYGLRGNILLIQKLLRGKIILPWQLSQGLIKLVNALQKGYYKHILPSHPKKELVLYVDFRRNSATSSLNLFANGPAKVLCPASSYTIISVSPPR